MPSDLKIRASQAGAEGCGRGSGARFFLAEQLHPEATAGRVEMVACPWPLNSRSRSGKRKKARN